MAQLYLVPTPIGNLGDLTFRALEVLRSVDLVLCEDTRVSGKLLKHYEVSTRMLAFHQHNEHRMLSSVVQRLKAGEKIALLSDAGMPGISDPGFLLVRECVKENIAMESLPGPTAFVPALVASGIPCDRFCFEGFLPVKKGRKSRLEALSGETRTMVFYESPHRLAKTLQEFVRVFGNDRAACVSREISKIHETHHRGSLIELCQWFEKSSVKGEITVIVAGRDRSNP
ncbi:MAG: 16S rRNA (cytidine(1402)-2'-O)-methyltransferase [Bacteroidales bacterium]|nr:16S rRNA (cytidine(1402)-2'-O)-methyltransferase [Bacteroidales bacterium]